MSRLVRLRVQIDVVFGALLIVGSFFCSELFATSNEPSAVCAEMVVAPGQGEKIEGLLKLKGEGVALGDIRVEGASIEVSWTLGSGAAPIEVRYRLRRLGEGAERLSGGAFSVGALWVERLSPCGGDKKVVDAGCQSPELKEKLRVFEGRLRETLRGAKGIRWKCPDRAAAVSGDDGGIAEKLEVIHKQLSEKKRGPAAAQLKGLLAGVNEASLSLGRRLDLAVIQAELGDKVEAQRWLSAALKGPARAPADRTLQLAAKLALGKTTVAEVQAGPCAVAEASCVAVPVADLLVRLGRLPLAVALLDAAVNGTKRPAASWYKSRISLALDHPEAGGEEKAAALLERAVHELPNNLWLQREAMYRYQKNGHYLKALPYLRAVYRLSPKDEAPDGVLLAGFEKMLHSDSASEAARAAWKDNLQKREQALKGKKRQPSDLFEQGLSAYYANRYKQALSLLEDACRRAPTRVLFLIALAKASFARSQTLQIRAQQYAERATQLAPDNSIAHFCMAQVIGRADRGAALKSVRKALMLGQGRQREITDKEVQEKLTGLIGAQPLAAEVSPVIAAPSAGAGEPSNGGQPLKESSPSRRWWLVAWVLAFVAGGLYLLWRR